MKKIILRSHATTSRSEKMIDSEMKLYILIEDANLIDLNVE